MGILIHCWCKYDLPQLFQNIFWCYMKKALLTQQLKVPLHPQLITVIEHLLCARHLTKCFILHVLQYLILPTALREKKDPTVLFLGQINFLVIHLCRHYFKRDIDTQKKDVCIHIYVCTHARAHTHTHTHTYIYIQNESRKVHSLFHPSQDA